MTSSPRCNLSLEYRAFGIQPAVANRTVRGVCIPYERWQRIGLPDNGQRGRWYWGGSDYHYREKVRREAVRLEDIEEAYGEAFRAALKRKGLHDVAASIDHKPQGFGRMSDGNIRFKNTSESLNFEIDLPETPAGNRVLTAIQDAPDGNIGVSIGFRRKGRKSNIVRKHYDQVDQDQIDQDLQTKLLPAGVEQRATVDVGADSVRAPEQQEGELEGSDYFEGVAVTQGRQFRVYFTVDLREVSLLVKIKPRWEGVFAQLGTGDPVDPQWGWRQRQLQLVKLNAPRTV